MTGQTEVHTLPGANFSGPGLLKRVVDPVLVVNGSLCLIEPAHPANPDLASSLPIGSSAWNTAIATLPADGAAIGNVAHDIASAFMSVPDDANMKSLMHRTLTTAGTSNGKAERSTLGGYHGILTQSAYTSGVLDMIVDVPVAVLAYMALNYTHQYYISYWGKTTRAPITGLGGVYNQLYKNAGSGALGGVYCFTATDAGTFPQPADGTHRGGVNEVGQGALGLNFLSIAAIPSQAIVVSDFAANGDKSLASWGKTQATTLSSSVTYNNKWQSNIWYRTYIEDLTASGRKYLDVDAIEYGNFQRQVVATTGRYYSDTTPTAPSSIP